MTTLTSGPVAGNSPLLGDLAVRPTGFRDGLLDLQPPAPGTVMGESRFWGAKVLWVVVDSRALPVRITGRAADASTRGEVRFNGTEGAPLESELTIAGPETARQGLPSYVRIDQPGCYEFYLDSAAGSGALTFHAELTNS